MKRLTLVAVLIAISVFCVYAFQFSPMEQTFEASGANAQKTYTIVNDSDDDIAIKLSVMVRGQDEEGNEIREKTSNEFQLSASQIIVKANSSYVIRVKYRGSSTVTTEKSYRLIAEQVSYSKGKDSESQSMFNFLYVYVTSLYVSPTKAVESVELQDIVAREDEEGNRYLDVTISNKGNVHKILNGMVLQVTDPTGKTVTLETSDQLLGLCGSNILAKKTITKSIPLPEGLEFSTTGVYTGIMSFAE